MSEEVDKSRRDAAIARIGARQHGVITADQIGATGMSSTTLGDRLATGRLHRIHRGVYAVGHTRLSNEGRWMAAVLACGDGAVLSHLSAAELWGIHRRSRRPSIAGGSGGQGVHVTVPGTAGKRKRAGILLHRSSTLTASDCTRRDGIPVTTPARTLADLRPLLSPAQLAAAVREAEFLRLPLDGGRPEFVTSGAGRRPASDGGPAGFASDRARTDLETVFLALCSRHRLPQPEVNVNIDRYEVDFLWRKARLIVEVDGWDSHRTRSAFEEDRARDARLTLLGYTVVRFTWRQIKDDRPGVARTVRALLGAGAT